MSYSHYGKIGDIWKHLPLCSFLNNEKPKKYIESNSAKACYELSHTPEQTYGAYTFLRESPKSSILVNSPYFKILKSLNHKTNHLSSYLGSPALALILLSNHTNEFIFYDTDSDALENINYYIKSQNYKSTIKLLNEDSRDGLFNIIANLDENTFIHFDPYYIFENNNSRKNIFDAFLLASTKGVKCMLWYGFNTIDENTIILNSINDKITKLKLNKVKIVEISLEIIQKDEILVNPGILGCGVLICNMSDQSFKDIEILSDELVSIYKGSKLFNNYSGELFKKSYLFN